MQSTKHPSQTTTTCKFYKGIMSSIQTKNGQQTQTRSRTDACKCFPHRLKSKPFLSLPFMLSCRRMQSALSTNLLTVFMRLNNLIFDTLKDRHVLFGYPQWSALSLELNPPRKTTLCIIFCLSQILSFVKLICLLSVVMLTIEFMPCAVIISTPTRFMRHAAVPQSCF